MPGNIILDTDSYKASHWLQYPPGTTNQFNYLVSRGGRYDKTVFFGLQYLLEQYLSGIVITLDDVNEAADYFKSHGVPFNRAGWEELYWDYGGYLPLEIKALPEGMVVPTGMPLLTCRATDPEYFWLVGWFETQILRIWYPITVATVSWHIKQLIKSHLYETADDLSGLPFKLHDFGSRGVSSRESAAIGGAAHLVNFLGTDTVVALQMLREVYGEPMAGFSIPAAEHSTITSWGRDGETAAYENMLQQFAKPGAILAVVSDSYDIYNAVEKIWGETLRKKVIDSGATVVIRPDSGDPVEVVTKVLALLDQKFGSKLNSRGYKVLNHVRVIQGDGVNQQSISNILAAARVDGFSADNLAFGMGGALLQQVNRDTQKFAYKCSAVEFTPHVITYEDGRREPVTVWKDVYKDPVTDPGKTSLKGLVGTKIQDGQYVVCQDSDPDNLLRPVFRDGFTLVNDTLSAIRARSEQ